MGRLRTLLDRAWRLADDVSEMDSGELGPSVRDARRQRDQRLTAQDSSRPALSSLSASPPQEQAPDGLSLEPGSDLER